MTMRPFTRTISIDDARAIIAAGMPLIDRRERVPLLEASGRVLAADVVAAADVPPFDRASMDGYALVAADSAGASRERPARLRLAGRVYTGDIPVEPVETGACVEVATGAPVPAGAEGRVAGADVDLPALDVQHPQPQARVSDDLLGLEPPPTAALRVEGDQ